MLNLIVNPHKFKSATLTRNKSGNVPTGFSIVKDIASIDESMKIVGIHQAFL